MNVEPKTENKTKPHFLLILILIYYQTFHLEILFCDITGPRLHPTSPTLHVRKKLIELIAILCPGILAQLLISGCSFLC